MGIVQLLWKTSNQSAYEWANWIGKYTKRIKVEMLHSKDTQRASNGNLIVDEGRITLRTRYIEQYGINDTIIFRGKRYVITGFANDNYEILPQNAAIVKGDYLQDVTMFLFEVNSDTRNIPCATPVITVSGTTATIICDTEYATIYYTTNGTRPSSMSTKYTGEFDIGTAEKIYAIAVQPNYMPSAVGAWSL